jgi:hypothetical protein
MKKVKVIYTISKVCSDLIEVEDDFELEENADNDDSWYELSCNNPQISTNFPLDLKFDNNNIQLDIVRLEILDTNGKCVFNKIF